MPTRSETSRTGATGTTNGQTQTDFVADALLQRLVNPAELPGMQAFSAEYIANILAARRRIGPEPAALQLTRRADLLELDMPEPDLSIYDRHQGTHHANTK